MAAPGNADAIDKGPGFNLTPSQMEAVVAAYKDASQTLLDLAKEADALHVPAAITKKCQTLSQSFAKIADVWNEASKRGKETPPV